MSTPQIPHLSNFRRRGPRSRGGRGHGAAALASEDASQEPTDAEKKIATDKIVQNTDNDASVSRLSAVQAGYLSDPFASLLTTGEPARRYPIINRGTYVRNVAIDRLVDLFLSSNPSTPRKQIISLGAGSDTRYFRFIERYPSLIYHEIDFPANTRSKISSIRNSPLLQRLVVPSDDDRSPPINAAGTSIRSLNYHLHPLDLRDIPTRPPDAALPSVDTALPTLIISECCLCYLSPADASVVARYFTNSLFPPTTPLAFTLYEPIRPFDAFGRTMVANLAARGIVLQTLQRYSSLAAQKERLRADFGYGTGQGASDIDFIWENWTDEREKDRVAGVEMLDEIEEWKMLASHYCVAWAWRSPSPSPSPSGGDESSTVSVGGEPEEEPPWVWTQWENVKSQDGG